MFVIGITGGIGCGKSTAAAYCADAGLPVIDADRLSHQVTSSGGAAIEPIRALFGDQAIDGNGALDRLAMARRVFNDRRALDRLSAIVHQHVIARIKENVAEMAARGVRAAVLDVPIPVRDGFLDQSDEVWLIWADEAIRLARLEARGMPADEARRRIAMQMNEEQYRAIANRVFLNNDTPEALSSEIGRALDEVLGERGIRTERTARC